MGAGVSCPLLTSKTSLHARWSNTKFCVFCLLRVFTNVLLLGGLGVEDQENGFRVIFFWVVYLPKKGKALPITGYEFPDG
jgi:hypothetical protein